MNIEEFFAGTYDSSQALEQDKRIYEGRRQDLERQYQERLQIQQFKQQRILNCKEDKKNHALNKLLEHTESYPEQASFSIDYHNFNYEDRMDQRRLLEKFFGVAQKAGCFKNFSSQSYNGGVKMGFRDVNIKKIEKFKEKLLREEGAEVENSVKLQSKNFLESIQLVTVSLEPKDVIFIVMNHNYNIPIRCEVKNVKGEIAYIKKLYDIAYISDVPGKKVNYDKGLADRINNALFRKRAIKKFMKTNNFTKPTLVQKSEDKKTLVLKGDVLVETILVKNTPTQYQYIYLDKTK